METTTAFRGLECRRCTTVSSASAGVGRCPEPDCDGLLDPVYDYERLSLTREAFAIDSTSGLWDYADLLPVPESAAITMGEGGTPLVSCPALAEELGVSRVFIKDEGHNPTGTIADRGQALATSAAAAGDGSDVALPSTGNGGQAAAAYGARGDLDVHAYLPSRSTFNAKAMVNVHGGDMTVVGGRLDDARGACADAVTENDDWRSVAPFENPYYLEGTKTLLYEIAAQLDWEMPDVLVHPTGDGAGLVGAHKGATELRELGLTDDSPRFYAAQAAGCAPIVEAWAENNDRHEPWETPDTICGALEVADPIAGPWILEALRKSGGGAVSTDDDDILSSAITVSQNEGIEIGTSAAAAASGAWVLAENGAFEGDETIVLVNTATGEKEADVLRSHLMGMGI